MAKSLAYSQQKYERNTANAGSAWKSGVEKGDYCGEMTQFLGGRPNSMCANWSAGVGAVSAGDFQASITGKGNAWAAGLRRKVGM